MFKKFLYLMFFCFLITGNIFAVDGLDADLKVLRLEFANSSYAKDRAEVLFKIANVYEKNGNRKKAKLLYRQIIKNYSRSSEIMKLAEQRLLQI